MTAPRQKTGRWSVRISAQIENEWSKETNPTTVICDCAGKLMIDLTPDLITEKCASQCVTESSHAHTPVARSRPHASIFASRFDENAIILILAVKYECDRPASVSENGAHLS